jgi:flagellin
MPTLFTNNSARIGINALRSIFPAQELALERLSTGKRINSATDDSAGLAVSEKSRAAVNGLGGAARNTMDAISMVETIDDKAGSVQAILQRMKELAVQSATGTNTSTDRLALDLEFSQLWDQIQLQTIGETWNQQYLMKSWGVEPGNDYSNARTPLVMTYIDEMNMPDNPTGHLKLLEFKTYDLRSTFEQNAQMETNVRAYNAGTGQSKNFAINNYVAWPGRDRPLPTVNTQGTSVYGSAVLFVGNGAAEGNITNSRIDIKTESNAKFTMDQLDTAIDGVSSERAKYASWISRFQLHYENLVSRSMNQKVTLSKIEDSSFAIETKKLSKSNMMSQASTAILAQANQTKDIFLSLLERDKYNF